MSISWIKYDKDENQFRVAQRMGMDVYKINNLEQIDNKIEELIQNKCKTIIISYDTAGFSEDIIKKYAKNTDVNIIISPRK